MAPFFILWILCILGAWSVLPYVLHLGLVPSSVSFLKIFFLSTVQAALLFGLVCWLSYQVVPKTDLLPFVIDSPLKKKNISWSDSRITCRGCSLSA